MKTNRPFPFFLFQMVENILRHPKLVKRHYKISVTKLTEGYFYIKNRILQCLPYATHKHSHINQIKYKFIEELF